MTDNNWIEWKWTPEKPYPESLATMVSVKFADGSSDEFSYPVNVSFWYANGKSSNWDPNVSKMAAITHYKVVK